MAVKLTYKMIQDRNFVAGLGKLANFGGFKDQKLAYNVAKLIRKWEVEVLTAQELYIKLVKQFAVVDENGNLKTPEGGAPGSFEIPDGKDEAFKTARADFEKVELEIPVHKIRLEQLEGVGITPLEMNAMDALLVDMEAVPEEKTATA